jgi:two-component system heavy metal sensor histidine kinase CusS
MNPSGSIAKRLAGMFAAAALVVFSIVGVALYSVLDGEFVRHQEREITTRLEFMGHMIARINTVERWQVVQNKMEAMTPLDGSTQFWVTGPDPRFEYNGPSPEVREHFVRNGRGEVRVGAEARRMNVLTRVIPAAGDRPEVRLTVGVDPTRFEDTRRVFTIALLLLCAGGAAIVAGLGYRLARVGLAPLRRLSEEAQAISPKNRSQRLQPAALPPELEDLTTSFNGALDRLEWAYAQLDAFNADVAHELRTPLTNLIGQTQVALGKERTVAELTDVLQSNLEELDRLRSIVNDMLFLARADRGEVAKNRVRTSVAQEIDKSVEFLDVILDEAGVSVKVKGDAKVSIETALFRRAVTNLLQNAIEHSDRGAEIDVEVVPEAAGVKIAVVNSGAPIEDQHVVRLFDRFYRVDGARENKSGNHGLGLSIVKAVASMHGGAVFARSSDGRNTIGFTVADAW